MNKFGGEHRTLSLLKLEMSVDLSCSAVRGEGEEIELNNSTSCLNDLKVMRDLQKVLSTFKEFLHHSSSPTWYGGILRTRRTPSVFFSNFRISEAAWSYRTHHHARSSGTAVTTEGLGREKKAAIARKEKMRRAERKEIFGGLYAGNLDDALSDAVDGKK